MNIKIEKTTIITTLIVLLLAGSTIISAIQTSNAQTYSNTFEPLAYIVVTPSPVGVDQTLSVLFWLSDSPPQQTGKPYIGWADISIKISRPDGQTEIKGPFTTDEMGSSYMLYTPTMTGIYTFQAVFPGQEINLSASRSLPAGLYYWKPCISREVKLTVQQEQIRGSPEVPLPEGYWTRPISAEHRDWSQISGDWLEGQGLGGTGYNTLTTAPESAHIMWTKPLSFGGIANGVLGWGKAYYNGIVYEPLLTPPVIISGRLYYNMFATSRGLNGVVCVDIRTGEEIWKDESMPPISRGQVYNFEGGSYHGASAYLWSTSGPSWKMFDAFTGRLMTTLENTSSVSAAYGNIAATAGKIAQGPNGEILMYILDGANNRITMWNSTRALNSRTDSYRPPSVVNWPNGIQWSNTIPDVPGVQTLSMIDYATGVIISESTIAAPTYIHAGYSTTTGEQLWVQNRTGFGYGFAGPTMPGLLSMFAPCRTINEGVYVFYQKETMQWQAFDEKTGAHLWASEPMNKFTDTDYSMYDWAPEIAYGKLFVTGYSGSVTAFDLKTGAHLWTYKQDSSGLDTPYGSWPVLDGVRLCDNKVYIPSLEHTPNTPMLKGYTLKCIDANTGDFLWSIPGFFTNLAFADGYIVGANGYDQQVYCFGMGTSETTVTATSGVGNVITIQGTVMDQSAGTKTIVESGQFSSVHAVSDVDMSEWMKYVYLQYPKPNDATGVSVKLTVKDISGNIVHSTQTTSDMFGQFAVTWAPENQGLYSVVATFEGTKGYFPSSAETHISVGSASLYAENQINSEGLGSILYIAIAAIALIVGIIAIILALRKR